MDDKYEALRAALPDLVAEAKRQGGTNPRAQMIIDLLADRDALASEAETLRSHNALLRGSIAQVERENDKLRQALEDIANVGGESTSGDGHARCREIACAALSHSQDEPAKDEA